MKLKKEVIEIIQRLNDYGYEAFIVGGCVRDMILKRVPKDFDITTSATPMEVKVLFEKTFDTGIQHGTVTVVMHKENYEVTTYRIDGEYEDGRHPKNVAFTKSLREDLLRRDFTMNAIAYHEQFGYVDYFGGIEDIGSKIIRGVGDPGRRFEEDALRMMRAIRFAAQLGFKIEAETYSALLEHRTRIQYVSIERIREELIKLIQSAYIENLDILVQSALLEPVNEIFHHYMSNHAEKIKQYLKASAQEEEILYRLFYFFMWMTPAEVEPMLKFFKWDNKTIKEVTLLVTYQNFLWREQPYEIKKMIQKLSLSMVEKLLHVQKQVAQVMNMQAKYQQLQVVEQRIQEIIQNQEPICMKDLSIGGEDLLALGIPKGRHLGVILDHLLDMVQKDPHNNSKEILVKAALIFFEVSS